MAKEEKKVSRIVLDDADTGDEILWFLRRKKPYLYLRDRDTKAFIKRLDFMELRLFMVVDYSYEEASKGNPLYLDAVGKTLLKPEEVGEMTGYEEKIRELKRIKKERAFIEYEFENMIEVIEAELEEGVRWHVIEKFGDAVETQLLDLAGVEYGSEPSVTSKYQDGKFYGVLVWKHHPEDEPRSLEEEKKL